MSLPPVLYVRDLRRLLDGWNCDRVRHFLVKNDLARYDEPRPPLSKRAVYTTPVIIGERMPDVLVAMEAKWHALQAGTDFDPDDFGDLADE